MTANTILILSAILVPVAVKALMVIENHLPQPPKHSAQMKEEHIPAEDQETVGASH